MARIINNTSKLFSTETQQVLNNAAANVGADTITTAKNSTDGGNETLFDFYDPEEKYLFSIDLDGNVIWNK